MPAYTEPVGGCTIFEQREYQNYTLIPSKQTVVCYVPPACTLDITGTTVTNVTVRGGSDGEIAAAVGGNTGSTITWYIDGVEDTTGTAWEHDFTGLTAGYYDISAIEGDCTAIEFTIQVLDGEFRTGDMVVTQPNDLTASENPIIYEVRTHQTGLGSKAEATIDFSGTISDGDYVKFDLTSPYAYSQTFYAKGFPDKSNYFLASVLTDGAGTTVGANTAAEIAQSFADALLQDVLIPKVYTISYAGGAIVYLKAKENGERFALTTNNVSVSCTEDNILFQTLEVGVNSYDGQQVDGYSVGIEVYENDKTLQYPDEGALNDYVRIAELDLPFQQSNIHRFDLAPILKNFVVSTRPRFEATGSTVQPDMMKPYYTRIFERYPLVANSNTKKKRAKTSTDVKWLINSALNHYSANDMQTYLGSTLHDVKSNFTASIDIDGAYDEEYNITFTNYLYQTGNTTGIQFRINDTLNGTDYGYQTGTTFAVTGDTSYPYEMAGKLYISGTTSGDTFVYDRNFSAYGGFGYISVYGTPDFEQNSGVLFLTQAPDPKLIQRASQEYLYFILKAGYDQQLDVRGDLEFWDGTSVTGATFFEIQSATGNSAGGVMALNISYDKLGLASYETYSGGTRKIKNATFAVYQASGDTKYTEDKTYRFEIEDRPRKFGIVWNNELGGWDAFDFVGIVESTINRTRGTYTIPIPYNSDGSAGQGFKSTASYNTKVTNKIIVNSGWIDEDHFDWLKELMESNDIYSYTTDNQNYLNLETFKYIKSSLDDLYEVECTFTQTIYENSIDV